MNKPRVTKLGHDSFEVNITGNRDYRSPDIDILVTMIKPDKISVKISKSNRCYGYEKTIEEQGFTELIFS